MDAPSSVPSTDPLQIRITPAGKIYSYVRHALDHLSEHPEQPVELHTRLPLPTNTAKPLPPIIPSKTANHSDEPSTSLLPCTTTIPRLISVIEIVKREFLLLNSRKGQGLWQYNRMGSYTREEVNAWEEQQRQRKAEGAVTKGKGKGKAGPLSTGENTGAKKADAVADQPMNTDAAEPPEKIGETETIARGDQVLRDLLTGAKHPKMSHAPYMSIILSTKPLPHLLSNQDISYQPVKPLGKKRRRKALTNAERKLKKARGKKGSNGQNDDTEEEEEEEEEEEVEEPEEVETLEVPESQLEESMEVVESLPKPAKKQKASR